MSIMQHHNLAGAWTRKKELDKLLVQLSYGLE